MRFGFDCGNYCGGVAMMDADGVAEEHKDFEYWRSEQGQYWRWAERICEEEQMTQPEFDVLVESISYFNDLLNRSFVDVWEDRYPIFPDRGDTPLGYDFHRPSGTISIWADYEGAVPVFRISETGADGVSAVIANILECNKHDSVNVAASMVGEKVRGLSNG